MQNRRIDPIQLRRRPHIRVPAEDVRRLQQTLTQDGITLQKLSEVIETSPELSLAFLRHTNAALFGLRRSVTSVRHAAALLGLRHLATFAERLAEPTPAAVSNSPRPTARTQAGFNGTARRPERRAAEQSMRPDE